MPGLFGIISSDAEQLNRFSERYQSYSPFTYKFVRTPSSCIGAHAFQGQSIVEDSRRIISVDGEYSIYQILADTPQELFHADDEFIRPTEKCKGVICVLDKFHGTLHIAADILGSFPLYYCISDDAFVFSSRIKPIADYFNAKHDNTGIMEFVLNGHFINNRTYFEDIKRCRAGEILTLNITNFKLKVDNYSKLWADPASEEPFKDLVDHASLLLESSFNTHQRTMIMMSAGWDSRTLLAAGIASGEVDNFKAYAHGDIASREIGIVSRICNASGVELVKQAISSKMYSLDQLLANLAFSENVVFPHWHVAGERANDLNVQQVIAGVYGEAFGGHYGPPCVLHGVKKMISVGKYLLNIPQSKSSKNRNAGAIDEAAALLKIAPIPSPWFISDDYWETYSKEILNQYNQDIEDILSIYQQRGVVTTENYVEAYTTEQRGAQYIASQLLSCRHHIDIALPYADPGYIKFATSLPFERKVHNRLNQAVVRSIAPELLVYPMAATLLSAGRHIFYQEASRAVRKVLESGQWNMHRLSKGAISEPRMGWANFQCLGERNAISDIIDSLTQPYWDKNKMKSWVKNVKLTSYHPLSDMLMKLLSADYCLDNTRLL